MQLNLVVAIILDTAKTFLEMLAQYGMNNYDMVSLLYRQKYMLTILILYFVAVWGGGGRLATFQY